MTDLTTTPEATGQMNRAQHPGLATTDHPAQMQAQVPDWRQLDFAADCLCLRSGAPSIDPTPAR